MESKSTRQFCQKNKKNECFYYFSAAVINFLFKSCFGLIEFMKTHGMVKTAILYDF